MKTRIILHLSYIAVSALLLTNVPVHAQEPSGNVNLPDTWMSVLTETGESNEIVSSIDTIDFNSFTPTRWKEFRATMFSNLKSNDKRTWTDAAVQAIYVSFFHPGQVNLSRAASELHDRYIFEKDENSRILALVGMLAIGEDNTMSDLVKRVRTERSPRVRSLTIAALADHYKLIDYYGRRTPALSSPSLLSEQQATKKEQ